MSGVTTSSNAERWKDVESWGDVESWWSAVCRRLGGFWLVGCLPCWLVLVGLCGCGSNKSYVATEQLLMSDAVDATVAKLDFRPLAGKRVYLDATYLKTYKSPLLVDSDYVISSLRQQMVAAGVLLSDVREEADLIAEARMGALGIDGHSVTYGLPASNTLATASSVFTSGPVLPTLPEVSLARREAKSGAAKLAVFAYERETRTPYWQSGIAKATSTAKDTWVLGAGPWQAGTIHDRAKFAGADLLGAELLDMPTKEIRKTQAFSKYRTPRIFPKLLGDGDASVVTAGATDTEPPAEQDSQQ